MKLVKVKFLIAFALSLILGGKLAYASPTYYPPERIQCRINSFNFLSCNDFNRRYLVEFRTNADLKIDKDGIFYFVKGDAYMIGDTRSVILYTYQNHSREKVRLRTIEATIRPDLSLGSWQRVDNNIYTCNAGYMHCAITHLPKKSI